MWSGDQLQCSLARRGRFIVFAFTNTNFGQRDQGLRKRRVLASGAFEDEDRFLQTAREPEVVAEHDGVFRRELSFLVEQAQVVDRELMPACGGIGHRASASGHEQTRVFLEHRGQFSDGELGLRSRGGHAAIEPRQKTNTIFELGSRRTAPRGRGARLPLA